MGKHVVPCDTMVGKSLHLTVILSTKSVQGNKSSLPVTAEVIGLHEFPFIVLFNLS